MLLTLWAKLDSSHASVVDAMYLREAQEKRNSNIISIVCQNKMAKEKNKIKRKQIGSSSFGPETFTSL
jgi:hypothetical protein